MNKNRRSLSASPCLEEEGPSIQCSCRCRNWPAMHIYKWTLLIGSIYSKLTIALFGSTASGRHVYECVRLKYLPSKFPEYETPVFMSSTFISFLSFQRFSKAARSFFIRVSLCFMHSLEVGKAFWVSHWSVFLYCDCTMVRFHSTHEWTAFLSQAKKQKIAIDIRNNFFFISSLPFVLCLIQSSHEGLPLIITSTK